MKMLVTHTWQRTITAFSSGAVPGTISYLANGMGSVVAGSIQPLYFDQMSAIYRHYVIIGSKVDLTFVESGTGAIPAMIATYLNDDSTLVDPDPDVMRQRPKSNFALVPIDQGKAIHRKLQYSAKKYHGGTVMSNVQLKCDGASVSPPTEQVVFSFSILGADKATTVVGYLTARITYLAMWFELIDIAAS